MNYISLFSMPTRRGVSCLVGLLICPEEEKTQGNGPRGEPAQLALNTHISCEFPLGQKTIWEAVHIEPLCIVLDEISQRQTDTI